MTRYPIPTAPESDRCQSGRGSQGQGRAARGRSAPGAAGLAGPMRMRRDERGSVAVEFAMLAPLLLLILAGVIDMGSAASVRLSLDARVTAAADYALLQPAPGDSQAAMVLAAQLVSLLQGNSSETAEVVVNNAARAQWTGTSAPVTALSGDAAMCYCPTLVGGQLDWGPGMACGAPCASGESAGQFVQVSATAQHSSLFPIHAFIDGDTVHARTVLRLQ